MSRTNCCRVSVDKPRNEKGKMGFGDLGKKDRLTRTGIEFSKAEPLSRVLKFHAINEDLLLDLFEGEHGVLRDEAFLKRVEKEAKIDDKVFSDLYFHHLVLSEGRLPKITSNRSFSALLQAYKIFSEFLISEDKEVEFQDKLICLYLFGFYKDLSIGNLETISRNTYVYRFKIVTQCSKYSAIPYMIDKKDKFLFLSTKEHASRAAETIKCVGGPDTGYLNLFYWGLIFFSLLNEDVNSEICEYFSENYHEVEEVNRIFQRLSEAV